MLRAQLAVVLNGRADGVSPHALATLETHRDDFAPGDLLRMLHDAQRHRAAVPTERQQQLLVEMLLVRFALLDRSVTLEEVLQTLGGGGAKGGEERAVDGTPPQADARPARSRPPAGLRRVQRLRATCRDLRRLNRASSSATTPLLRVIASVEQRRDSPAAARHRQRRSRALTGARSSIRRQTAAPAPRLTTEAVREERLAMLRAQDPVLDAAVRELDLDLLD